MMELRNQKKEFTDKINLINEVNENGYKSDKRLKFISNKILNTLENLDKAEYDVKKFIVNKLVKSIEISSDYSIKIHFAFEP